MLLPDGTWERSGHSADGALTWFSSSGRNDIRYEYDAVGKIAKVDCANLADTLFTFDGAGRRIARASFCSVRTRLNRIGLRVI
jgi:YD repeat-containing protein